MDQRQTPRQGDYYIIIQRILVPIQQAMKTVTHKVVASLSSLHQLGGHVLNGATEGIGAVVLKQQHMMTSFVTGLTQQPVS